MILRQINWTRLYIEFCSAKAINCVKNSKTCDFEPPTRRVWFEIAISNRWCQYFIVEKQLFMIMGLDFLCNAPGTSLTFIFYTGDRLCKRSYLNLQLLQWLLNCFVREALKWKEMNNRIGPIIKMYRMLPSMCCINLAVCHKHNSLPLGPIQAFISYYKRAPWFLNIVQLFTAIPLDASNVLFKAREKYTT